MTDPRTFIDHEAIQANGGFCVPVSSTYRLGTWPPRFAPVPFWRNWRRRWNAGGPLLGHTTPPPPAPLRLPAFTAPRGGIRFISP